MFSAAVLPWLKATSQCSIRIGRPWTGLSYSQMSPAAKIPGTELSSPLEHFTPPASPSSSPACAASVMSGITPAPITTASQSSSSPLFVTTLRTRPSEPSKRSSSSPAVHLDPVLLQHAVEEAAHLGPVGVLERDVLQHHDRALHPVRAR